MNKTFLSIAVLAVLSACSTPPKSPCTSTPQKVAITKEGKIVTSGVPLWTCEQYVLEKEPGFFVTNIVGNAFGSTIVVK